jgi:hypothetical protein
MSNKLRNYIQVLKLVFRAVRGPSQTAVDAHNAALIGSAVANALRSK